MRNSIERVVETDGMRPPTHEFTWASGIKSCPSRRGKLRNGTEGRQGRQKGAQRLTPKQPPLLGVKRKGALTWPWACEYSFHVASASLR